MAKFYAPDPIQSTYLIPGGNTVANGGQVFFYLAGTSTKTTVYKDIDGNTSWTNPIVLDAGGNLPNGGEVWFSAGESVKVVFAPSTDSDPPVSPYWTKDDLTGLNDTSVTTSEWAAGPTPTFVSSTSFTVTGDQTAVFTVGRRVRTTNTAGTIYSTVMRSTFSVITTVVLQNDSGALDSGLSAVSYSILDAAHPSVPQATFNAQPQINARLTLVSGQPIATSDVVSTVLFLTPYRGNTIDYYDGSANWNRVTIAQMSTAVPAGTGVHDVFAYNSTGSMRLETVAWTNNTTRASALSTVAGVPLKASDSRLYLGTFWATGGAIPDTQSTRALWNYWQPVARPMLKNSTTTVMTFPVGSSNTATVFGADSTNALTAVFGMDNVMFYVSVLSSGRNTVTTTNAQAFTGVGVDNFSTFSAAGIGGRGDTGDGNNTVQVSGAYRAMPGAGLHTFAWVTKFISNTSFTWDGTRGATEGNTGLSGIFDG